MAMQQLARERQVGLQEEQLRQAGDRLGIQGAFTCRYWSNTTRCSK